MSNLDTCPWCGMDRRGYSATRFFYWKCGTRQNSKGTRIQTDACAEIAQLKARVEELEYILSTGEIEP